MAKLFGSKAVVTDEKEVELKPVTSNVKVFKFPENVSMKKDGDSIEGIYKGILVKNNEGMNGGDLLLAVFEQDSGYILTCVAGSQVIKFLRSFPVEQFLKITRTGTKQTKQGNPFATYQFECDTSVKLGNDLLLIQADTLPEVKKIVAHVE